MQIGLFTQSFILVFNLANFEDREKLLKKLGRHKMSGASGDGCLYINKLDDINLEVLEAIIEKAYHYNKFKIC